MDVSNSFDVISVSEDDRMWQELIRISDNSTPFIREDYLNCVGYEGIRYIVLYKNKLTMGLCLTRNIENGLIESCVPYAPYQGLIFQCNQGYDAYHRNIDATGYLLDYLFEHEKYDHLEFSNNFNVKDLRGVQWHHYHEADKGIYGFKLMYTGILKLDDFDRKQMSKGRKLDLRYSSERYGIYCEYSEDIRDFTKLYKATFQREGIVVDDKSISMVNSIVENAICNKYGKLCYAYNENGQAINATFVLEDDHAAYYIFGANDPEARKCGGATLLLSNQIEKYRDEGKLDYFDFIGVNSPFRGDFKLSFGAEVKPYFVCAVDY